MCTATLEVDDDDDDNDGVISCLFSFLQSMFEAFEDDPSSTNSLFSGEESPWMSCVALETLKTLTSLTHENVDAVPIAARADGWQLLAQVIYAHSAVISLPHRHDDLAVFAVDTMANLIESSSSSCPDQHDIMTHLKVVDTSSRRAKTVLFLPWLVKHLVKLTEGFKSELLHEDDSESRASASSARKERVDEASLMLDNYERDNLLLSGNGFVLLAYLLLGNNNGEVEGLILSNLPGAFVQYKIGFLQKALTAFGNYYRHTVGELSMAIVAPIQSLLHGLNERLKNLNRKHKASSPESHSLCRPQQSKRQSGK
mmetsp:Transcript_11060/g.24763  ORF Transcript_11060/g.24763 Transcript_11060/m.24763 type:complete len:313 (-) Transcript_11060:65-1003(-)